MQKQCPNEIKEKFSFLINRVIVESNRLVTAPCSEEDPQEGGIVYLKRGKNLPQVLNAKVSFLVIEEGQLESLVAKELWSETFQDLTVVTSSQLQLMMAEVNRFFFLPIENRSAFDEGELRHSSSIVHKTATIGPQTILSPGVVIGEGVAIGANCYIGANSVVEAGAKIGDNVHLHPQVFIGYKCELEEGVVVKPHTTIGTDGFGFAQDNKGNHYRKPHYGKVILKKGVHIGANVTIDRGTFSDTVFEEGCIVDNHCHFGHNFQLGKNTIVTGGFLGAGSSKIGAHCVVGGRTTVTGHISVTDQVHLAGLSGVSKSITQPGAYGGYPLQKLKDFLRSSVSIAKLPEFRKQLRKLTVKVDKLGE